MKWPKNLNDINPLNEVWFNVNKRLDDDCEDPGAIYQPWLDAKVDLDDFNHVYRWIKNRDEELVKNEGNFKKIFFAKQKIY